MTRRHLEDAWAFEEASIAAYRAAAERLDSAALRAVGDAKAARLGAILPLRAVWTYGDVALGLMTLPNLAAVVLLSGSVAGATREYFSRKHEPFK